MERVGRKMYLLAMVAALLVGSSSVAQAGGWTYNSSTSTFELSPSLVSGDAFIDQWKVNSTAADAYIYDHDMSVQTGSWYGASSWDNLKSYASWTGSESYADMRIQSDAGGIVGLRSTTWHNANQPDLQLDVYNAYSSDDGANYNEYFRTDWDLGSPAGTGYGAAGVHSAQTMIDSPGLVTRLQYGTENLTAWDEYYGSSWRVWGKSAETSYSDNYTSNPFAATEGGPFWSTQRTSWLDYNGGSLANNYAGNQTEVVYLISHVDAMADIDIRLTSTDLSAGAEAVFCAGTETMLHLAIATEADGTYTDVYTTTQWKSQANNPGALVDLSAYGNPDTLFVKIYSTTGASTSNYIRWSGFQVDVTAVPEPATMVLLGLSSVGMLLKRRRN